MGERTFERLFIGAIAVLPFSQLRIGFLGLGEVLILLLFLYELTTSLFDIFKSKMVFSRFWLLFLGVCILGFLFNYVLLGYETGTLQGMIFDFTAYVFVFIACYTIENRSRRTPVNYLKLLKNVFMVTGFIFSLLFIVSFFTPSVFGFTLRQYIYFAPLVDNLHQSAMFLAPMPLIGLFLLSREKKVLHRVIIVLLVIAFSFMTYQTGSFKAFVGVALGYIIYVFSLFFMRVPKQHRFALIGFIAAFSLIYSLWNFENYTDYFLQIFYEEDPQGARSSFYMRAVKLGFTSFVVGLGAGQHISHTGGFWDVHQTFLTVFVQAGIVGLVLFFGLILRLLRRFLIEISLLGAFVPIIIYAAGGDILRRLPIWLLLVLLYYVSFSDKVNSNFSK